MGGADLHVHSTASDGRFSPREVVRRAHGAGLGALALTDHDTLSGIGSARAEAGRLGLDFIAGCEISIQDIAQEVHLLAYFIDDPADNLAQMLLRQQQARRDRIEEMIAKLRALGVGITRGEVEAEAAGATAIGRMHVAHALLRRGDVGSLQAAFVSYLGDGAPAYVPKKTDSAADTVTAVWDVGAVPVLAHPGLMPLDNLETHFSAWDLGGIEAHHPSHSAMMRAYLVEWAGRRGIPATGGSDWHGDENPRDYIGCMRVEESVVRELRAQRRAPR